jgi:type IV pilus assembly protein PilY1
MMDVFSKRFTASESGKMRPTICGMGLMVSMLCVFCLLGSPARGAELDLADAPLFTKIQPPPADIMMLLDDSGSMSFEMLVKDQYDGYYPDPDNSDTTQGFCYLFENLGDGVYSDDWRYMTAEDRKYWQSQWYGANAMYYNPNLTYTPWPSTVKYSFGNAHPANPRPHPVIVTDKTLDLHAKSFEMSGQFVDHAHYYVQSGGAENKLYLVELEDLVNGIVYFEVGVTGSGLTQKVSSLSSASPPDDVRPKRKQCGSDPETEEFCSYAEELQNFANWYTYYRRREYTAKAAIARVITNIKDVRIGIYGINKRIKLPLLPVNATIGETLEDDSEDLLNKLYEFQSEGGTPLKKGLQKIGEYYKKNSTDLAGESGDAPFPDPDDGGTCQQAFTIMMTDGFYSDTGFDAKANHADKNEGQPYADDFEDTLADIAMYYYKDDLLLTYKNEVPTNKFDKATYQHMVTYGVAFGVTGTKEPKDYWLDPTDQDTYMKHKTSESISPGPR